MYISVVNGTTKCFVLGENQTEDTTNSPRQIHYERESPTVSVDLRCTTSMHKERHPASSKVRGRRFSFEFTTIRNIVAAPLPLRTSLEKI